jgi:hypothetical protein
MQKPELGFYTMMQYPMPPQEQYFYYRSSRHENRTRTNIQKDFHNGATMPTTWENESLSTMQNFHISKADRHKKKSTKQIQNTQEEKKYNKIIQTHRNKIKRYKRLRKNLPYIEHIYLCDSMSFDATDAWSDIDLFFIVKHGCIWRARLLSVIICTILGIKRSMKKKSGLFDLIFYVDEKHTNLEPISLQPEDIYLNYRLAHLIPLYQNKPYNIYTDNTRLQKTLPNFPMKHITQSEIQTWSWWIKKTREIILWIRSDNFWEQSIKSIRKPLVIKKKKQHKESWRGIVITDRMLKFHKDRRIEIQQKRELYKQTEESSDK